MERATKHRTKAARPVKKISIECTQSHLRKVKSKDSDLALHKNTKIQALQIPANLNKLNQKAKNTALEPLLGNLIRPSKHIPIREQRNRSVEGMYDLSDQAEPSLKRNSSVLDKYPKHEAWDNEKVPYSPGVVLKKFSNHLSSYEQSEILSYHNIYYIAIGVLKFKTDSSQLNNGFDDERNDLILVKNDHIAYRYEILEIIGRGSYGQVIKAYDHKDKKLMALKIIRNLACIIQQARIEIQVLYKMLQQTEVSEYVVHIVDNCIFRNHLIESFNLLDVNLYQYLKAKSFNPLSLNEIKLYAKQILEGMKFYHSLGILHCDIKPENVMLAPDQSKVVIIDFGSACFTSKRIFTYIQSRYYRAPEVILEIGYDYKIDIWSLGCVLAELAIGRPLFPGRDEIDQLLAITEYLGLPPTFMIEKSPKFGVIVESIKKQGQISGKIRVPGSRSLKKIVPCKDHLFLDFLNRKVQSGCFCYNLNERFSAEEALDHEWLRESQIQRHPSLPDLIIERNSSGRNASISKKLSFDQPLTQRAIRKKIVFQNNFY